VTIIAVSLGVTLTSGAANAGSGNEGSQSYIEKFPTSSPTLSPTRIDDGFIDILSGVSSWESLTTPGTPQFQAMVWLSTFDVSAVEPTDPRFLQRYALVVIYFASGGGKSWLEDENWLEPTLHECDWGPSTIECRQDSALSRIVSSLDLTRNGLAGSLPPEVGILTGLETFKASKNNLKGEIPEQLFSLSSLVTLEMGLNSLSGSIPRSIINATELEYLDMSNNQLASTLPIQLFRLFNLRWLDLSSNLITGTLSTELGQLKLITSINFQHNLLTGGIPNAFDDLPDLDFILLGT
jgi:Leucine-rich repeat (LRR) protein